MSVNQDRSTLMIYVLLRRAFSQARCTELGFSKFINLPKHPEDKVCP